MFAFIRSAALAAASLALALGPALSITAAPPRDRPTALTAISDANEKAVADSVVARIVCGLPDRQHIHIGSGVWIGPHLLVSADHVVSQTVGCAADGRPARMLREYGELDFAVLAGQNPGGLYAPFSCAGIQPGHSYEAVGYAFGFTHLSRAGWLALPGLVGDPGFVGLARFLGLSMPGMSGGLVYDRRSGLFAAIINATHGDPPEEAWGRQLADTYLCQRGAAL